MGGGFIRKECAFIKGKRVPLKEKIFTLKCKKTVENSVRHKLSHVVKCE